MPINFTRWDGRFWQSAKMFYLLQIAKEGVVVTIKL
jgi:hypothetical protein